MLFIYDALYLGGIETFFVRMAKERHKNSLKTKILLYNPLKSDKHLLGEMKKYAEVFSLDEIMLDIPRITSSFLSIMPLKKKRVKLMLENIHQIHVSTGKEGLLAYRLINDFNLSIPVTVGFYHHITFSWGGYNVAYHERENRRFILNYLPKKALLCYSEENIDFYKNNNMKIDLTGASTFNIGTVDKNSFQLEGSIGKILKICSVGRLVDLKTYNSYMIDIVASFLEQDINMEFDIYGDGPLKEELSRKIEKMNMQKHVRLKGSFDYACFDEIVSGYDLFIGTGTAIIQASSLGVCSIVGIEDTIESKTYGYFCDVYNHQYTRKGLDIELFDIKKIIINFIGMSSIDRVKLKQKHLDSIEQFTNEACLNNFIELESIKMPNEKFKYNHFRYGASNFFDKIMMKLNKNHHWNTRHTVIRNS